MISDDFHMISHNFLQFPIISYNFPIIFLLVSYDLGGRWSRIGRCHMQKLLEIAKRELAAKNSPGVNRAQNRFNRAQNTATKK